MFPEINFILTLLGFKSRLLLPSCYKICSMTLLVLFTKIKERKDSSDFCMKKRIPNARAWEYHLSLQKNSVVTWTIAGSQFQCMCSGFAPVSNGASSGPILMILWYSFNNIYLIFDMGNCSTDHLERWRSVPIRCCWGYLPTNYWSSFVTLRT